MKSSRHEKTAPALHERGRGQKYYCCEIAARRLIALDVLAEALVWHGGVVHADTDDDCWSDVTMLRARIRACTPPEIEYLHRRFERIEVAA